MATNAIYTLDWIKKEAEDIASSWNGKDITFYYEGEKYHEDDVSRAEDLLEKIEEVEKLISELRI